MKTSLSVLLAALFAAVSACSDGNGADQVEQPSAPAQSSAQPSVLPTHAAGVAAALPDFAALVDQYGKAVVNVEVLQQARPTRGPGGGANSDDPLLDFFRRFGLPAPGSGGRPEDSMPARGAGSGFIVSNDG
ncbi:MAG TPA: hypothetical protein VJT80_21755, partial [Steroidobacteraceae bacterium]|nr:hypothetical protein [Steroidobacteraceae bacterium]